MTAAREQWRERVAQWRSSGETARAQRVDAVVLGVAPGAKASWRADLARTPAMIAIRARPVADDRFEIEIAGRRVRVRMRSVSPVPDTTPPSS